MGQCEKALEAESRADTKPRLSACCCQDAARLRELHDAQVAASRQGWYENMVHVTFSVGALGAAGEVAPPGGDSDSELLETLEAEYEQELAALVKQRTSARATVTSRASSRAHTCLHNRFIAHLNALAHSHNTLLSACATHSVRVSVQDDDQPADVIDAKCEALRQKYESRKANLQVRVGMTRFNMYLITLGLVFFIQCEQYECLVSSAEY